MALSLAWLCTDRPGRMRSSGRVANMSTIPQPQNVDLEDRLAFIGLSPEASEQLKGASRHIEKHLTPSLDRFYEKLSGVPAVARFFSGKEQMGRAQDRQADHWRAIATGAFDEQYMASSRRIGLRHAQIGLEPRWYIGGYAMILDGLIEGVLTDLLAEQVAGQPKGLFRRPAIIDAEALSRVITAMVKAVLLDVDLAVTTYFDKMTEEAAERDRKGKAEIERTVSLTGDALQRLAPGNLTTRLTDAFTPEFDQIKTDTDLVFDHLEQLVRRLRAASRSLKTATGEILSGANDLAGRTTRQAATIEETSAAMEQLMETVADNARRAEQASNMAASASALASDGGKVMGEANAAMERIAVSSDQIRNIIGMIDDIAFQTNLLALEAARAERPARVLRSWRLKCDDWHRMRHRRRTM